MDKKISFIGIGNMASAIIRGIDKVGVCLYDRMPGKAAAFGDKYITASSAGEAVGYADIVFICVKPQNVPELFGMIRESGVSIDDKVFVSIVAGYSTADLCAELGREVAIVRTMPNMPLLIGMGVTAMTRNSLVSDGEFAYIKALFDSLGDTFVIGEDKMNAVVSVNGSSPAYVYYFIDTVVRGAEKQGFCGDEILRLICKVFTGAAETLARSGKTPDEMIKIVCSPGGTTERAIAELESGGIYEAVEKAMDACTRRAEELSK